MAPEVMRARNHSFTVDFFAIGIIGYEFMLGRRPYNGRSRREIKEQMLSKNVEINFSEIPNGWSEDAADFFNKLLQRKPELRLGHKGIWELKQHRWMKYFPWDKLINKELEAPFIPEKKDNFDKKYCEAVDSINIETKIRYEKYKNDFEYDNLFKNFTYYGIITENQDKDKEKDKEKLTEKNSLTNSTSIKSYDLLNNMKVIDNKENNDINTNDSNDDLNVNFQKNNKYIFINLANDDIKIKEKDDNDRNNNNKKNKYAKEKITNIVVKKKIKNYSFTMKLIENENPIKNKSKHQNSRIINDDELKQSSTIRSHNNNNYIPEDFSQNISDRSNHINYKLKQNKNCRSKTPVYMGKKNFSLDTNKKKLSEFNESQNRSMANSNVDSSNRALIMNQYQYMNYKENIRNLFSKKAKQKMNICSPGYYSKHSLQINCNSNKYNQLLQKRNIYFSKSPIGSMNSNSKSPKITTSTSNSMNGYKKRSRSISPLVKSKISLRQSSSAKNIYNKFINDKNNNSRLNLSNLYNQNFSYVKRIKEMNSFNYNNNNIKKIINNIHKVNSIKSKNKQRNNEIISSYSISSSNILKDIRKTNYNKNKVNIINNNNPPILYKNSNINQKSKRNNHNNKIRVELELNADSQTFNRQNRINNDNTNEKMYKNAKSSNKFSIKNNIINKNNSTINIGSMKMAMNGNININVVIKGNNNTTNLINKIEVKKKTSDNYSKNRNNKKKFERSHSIGYFKIN